MCKILLKYFCVLDTTLIVCVVHMITFFTSEGVSAFIGFCKVKLQDLGPLPQKFYTVLLENPPGGFEELKLFNWKMLIITIIM